VVPDAVDDDLHGERMRSQQKDPTALAGAAGSSTRRDCEPQKQRERTPSIRSTDGRRSSRNQNAFACLRCGRVGDDVRRYAVSDVLRSVEVVRCRSCIDLCRSDVLMIVEELEA